MHEKPSLIMLLSAKQETSRLLGEDAENPQVLEALVYGACRELFEYAERPQKCGFSKTRRLATSNRAAAHTD